MELILTKPQTAKLIEALQYRIESGQVPVTVSAEQWALAILEASILRTLTEKFQAELQMQLKETDAEEKG